MVVIAVEPGGEGPGAQPSDQDVQIALYRWCRSLGLYEAASFIRRTLRRQAHSVTAGEAATLWMAHPDPSAGVSGTVQVDRDPSLSEVVTTLARTRADRPAGRTYARLASLIEPEIWP